MVHGTESVHSVYKIEVGGQVYFGYTSRDPQERLKEHLDIAYRQNWRHNSRLYPALVEMEYEYDFEVLHEFDTELEALIKEIQCIRETNKALLLNNSKGGEGRTLLVCLRDTNGKLEFKVKNRKVRQEAKPAKPTRPRKRRGRKYRRQ